MSAPYGVANDEIGKNNYFFATQKCAELGGFLPDGGEAGRGCRAREAGLDDRRLAS